jgi:hypothetical protein
MQFFERLFGKPSMNSFAKQILRGLRDAGATEELSYDPAEFRIVQCRDGKEVGVVNLGNMYQTHLALGRRHRAQHLNHCVRVAMRTSNPELPTDFALARRNLRPKLWSRSIMEHLRLQRLYTDSSPDALDLPCQPVGEHVLACLVYDWPESVQSISQEDLEGWGVTVYEALEAAKENLETSRLAAAQIGDHLFSFVSGDSYDAVRLLLVDQIKEFDLTGRPVVMVPNRDSILITGSDDTVGLELMAEMAIRGLEQPYSLSGTPLILDDGEWVDWMPPGDHPCHRRFRELELNFVGSLYAEQKQLLDAAHERGGIDIFVASFSEATRPDGSRVSFCVWGDGVDALLPVTHKVAFMQSSRENMAVFGDWARVAEVAGELMELTDDYPRRYRMRKFPDRAILEAIGLGEI